MRAFGMPRHLLPREGRFGCWDKGENGCDVKVIALLICPSVVRAFVSPHLLPRVSFGPERDCLPRLFGSVVGLSVYRLAALNFSCA